ncbi:MAG: MaoC family dehydratase [Firmicutes bacterium]|nr:MaoC family dehydratase [Bacillota bacterium]
MKNYYTYDEINVGDSASFSKTITEHDVYTFAGLIGDFNPVHINQPAAEKSFFKSRVAHGCLTDSFVSTVLGMKLPGEGTIFVSKSVDYLKPLYIGDTLTTTVTAAEKQGRGRILFDTVFENQKGEMVAKGTVLVIAPQA